MPERSHLRASPSAHTGPHLLKFAGPQHCLQWWLQPLCERTLASPTFRPSEVSYEWRGNASHAQAALDEERHGTVRIKLCRLAKGTQRR